MAAEYEEPVICGSSEADWTGSELEGREMVCAFAELRSRLRVRIRRASDAVASIVGMLVVMATKQRASRHGRERRSKRLRCSNMHPIEAIGLVTASGI